VRTTIDITKQVDEIQLDEQLEREFQATSGSLEEFYQAMLALGLSHKEDYNLITPGQASRADVTFLVS
jgi:hypothetical protein